MPQRRAHDHGRSLSGVKTPAVPGGTRVPKKLPRRHNSPCWPRDIGVSIATKTLHFVSG